MDAPMDAALLLLADSRLPAGGHAHSGGLETAAATGVVHDLATLAAFLRGRLATTGLLTSGLAAAACAYAHECAGPEGDGPPGEAVPVRPGARARTAAWAGRGRLDAEANTPSPAYESAPGIGWARLDAEADARTPSPAQRRASRAQGRALLRVARGLWPASVLDLLTGAAGGPHQPIVLGAAVAAAGGAPVRAAQIAAYGSVTGPASAAVRLLGLDPLGVHRVLAGLTARVDGVAAEAAGSVRAGDLPAASAPALDVFAELHDRADPRLFES
ncbi:urease accessory UreF family protein [Actinoallomurus sp. NPDC052274]|uniref:urease accessory protein UreF n=1 Tax=Actinoallomurus sp. NPDC052274 TaxID=3155420 RepID=UPI00344962B2